MFLFTKLSIPTPKLKPKFAKIRKIGISGRFFKQQTNDNITNMLNKKIKDVYIQ